MAITTARRAALALTLAAATVAPAAVGVTATAVPAATPVAAAAPAAQGDIKDRLTAIPGVRSVVEASAPAGYRFFRFTFTQPVDHDDPSQGTFSQRLTLLHKDVSRPMVMYTSGYNVGSSASRSEPTRIVDGNQISMEYRFFEPSRPAGADTPAEWMRLLTIRQAAADQHRVIEAFKPLYAQRWLTTGGSKGGMTATYHRRFYPGDVSGTIPYVAPNDVRDHQDTYNAFLARVGDADCRDALTAVQRRVLRDRETYLARLDTVDAASGYTYDDVVGNREKAFESSVIDAYYAFWQYSKESDCADIPDAATASDDEIWDWFDGVSPLYGYADELVATYTPYYFQADYQLGSPEPYEDRLKDLLRYPGANTASTFTPDTVEAATFDRAAMPDVDRWVRKDSSQMLYVYGENDPWSAEPFTCGPQGWKRACYRYDAPGGNHGSNIAGLRPAEREHATQLVLQWAGLSPSDPAVQHVKKTGAPDFNRVLDRPQKARGHGIAPLLQR
ncbi:S28 family serine protease [Janibacter melonis]|uniref:S28 family serine protease n=1 Tax=Janibacter melonis TaxID=262209 RepID=UPI001E483461|nr:S28 family serine protease [Janibacter melonis]MCB5992227.1 hypothetical protein [Janibacter melonis]